MFVLRDLAIINPFLDQSTSELKPSEIHLKPSDIQKQADDFMVFGLYSLERANGFVICGVTKLEQKVRRRNGRVKRRVSMLRRLLSCFQKIMSKYNPWEVISAETRLSKSSYLNKTMMLLYSFFQIVRLPDDSQMNLGGSLSFFWTSRGRERTRWKYTNYRRVQAVVFDSNNANVGQQWTVCL
jgi:hypothetical protein